MKRIEISITPTPRGFRVIRGTHGVISALSIKNTLVMLFMLTWWARKIAASGYSLWVEIIPDGKPALDTSSQGFQNELADWESEAANG